MCLARSIRLYVITLVALLSISVSVVTCTGSYLAYSTQDPIYPGSVDFFPRQVPTLIKCKIG